MLYVFVDKEQAVVYYATYNEEEAKKYLKYKHFRLCGKYYDDVEIYSEVY